MLKRGIYLALGAIILTTGTGCGRLWTCCRPLSFLYQNSYRTWYGCGECGGSGECDGCNNCGGLGNLKRGIGCGKMYWGDWKSYPPNCSDPCDCYNEHTSKSPYWGSPSEFASGEVIYEEGPVVSQAPPRTTAPRLVQRPVPKIARYRTPPKKQPVNAASYQRRPTPYR